MMTSKYDYASDEYIESLLLNDVQYFEKAVHFANKYIKNKSMHILDFGCGTGNLVKILKDQGFTNVIGVDLDEQTIKKGREINQLDNIYCINEVDLNSLKIDCLICVNVVEHVDDVKGFLSRLVNILSENGLLYLETPNYLNPFVYLEYYRAKRNNKPIHVTPFNKDSSAVMIYKFVRATIMTGLKMFCGNTRIWRVQPMDSKIYVGGDSDAYWVSNYLDVRNILARLHMKEIEKKTIHQKIYTDFYIGRKL